jgi:NADH dehydrogenase
VSHDAKSRTAHGAGSKDGRPHLVIVGGGFGGLTTAQAAARLGARITLVDRTNHHLFQPLLYQVATAGLTAPDIAAAIRSVLADRDDVTVLLDEVVGVDLDAKTVRLANASDKTLAYDYLVIAAGARTNYFGHDDWSERAPGMKSISDALEIRKRVLLSFEQAETTRDEKQREKLLTFAIVGGGPTGVELAGAVAELGRFVLASDFRHIRPQASRVVLIEAGPRLLPAFAPDLSDSARLELAGFGVDVRLQTRVEGLDADKLTLRSEDGTLDDLPAATVVWAAGVKPVPLAKALGLPTAKDGRVKVARDCSLPGHPDAFCIGDMAYLEGRDGKPLPGVSPVAMQQGRYVVKAIARRMDGQLAGDQGDSERRAFHYLDKGIMATIGRKSAVVQTGPIKMSGLVAWLAWLGVHIYYLIGFRNRLVVLFSWAWSYLTYRRGARVISEPDVSPTADAQAEQSRHVAS